LLGLRYYPLGEGTWSSQKGSGAYSLEWTTSFQGRIDHVTLLSKSAEGNETKIRHRFGCYDEITEVDRRRVRHCNWVRFLRAASTYSDEVNLIGTKVKGEPIYEAVKSIPANSELVVYFLPERPEEVFFMPAVHYLRNSLYRRTMDTILEDLLALRDATHVHLDHEPAHNVNINTMLLPAGVSCPT
ncbi:hypothetical protein L9F63_003503, partial [Diploptera punctata]